MNKEITIDQESLVVIQNDGCFCEFFFYFHKIMQKLTSLFDHYPKTMLIQRTKL